MPNVTFQRRHYETIAASISRTRMATNLKRRTTEREAGLAAIRLGAIDLAATFAADNPNFDRSRFMKACGIDG